jgi:hypothetical protein
MPDQACPVPQMLCRVLLMRSHGRRLPWRDIQNGAVHQGELSTHYMTLDEQRYFVATLMQPGDAVRREVLPRLYEPVLTTLGRGVLVLRGFERLEERDGVSGVVQEWRCEVMN